MRAPEEWHNQAVIAAEMIQADGLPWSIVWMSSVISFPSDNFLKDNLVKYLRLTIDGLNLDWPPNDNKSNNDVGLTSHWMNYSLRTAIAGYD